MTMIEETLNERCRKWLGSARGQRFGFTADELQSFVTSEILSLIGRIEAILAIADSGGRRMETAMDACDKIMALCNSALAAPNELVPKEPTGAVTEKFKDDSARAAIRALRGLEQTAVMLERWAPEIFPETTEVNGVIQKHFGRVMMESAAQAIRDSWSDAIKETENSDRANQVEIQEMLVNGIDALLGLIQLVSNRDDIPDEVKAALTKSHRIDEARAALAKAEGRA